MRENKVAYPIPTEDLHKVNCQILDSENITKMNSFSLLSKNPTVYHYTSPNGLMGILGNQKFFFTDSQFLNDANERKDINNILSDFWKKHSKSYDSNFVDLLKKIYVKSYEDVVRHRTLKGDNNFQETNRNYRYFVFSTSCESDSLNMWKYYAKNDKYDGYSIGLSVKYLLNGWNDFPRGVRIEEGKVLYKTEDKIGMVKNCVDQLYLEWCTYKEDEISGDYIADSYSLWIHYASLFFKNECFKDENEYRFVAIVRCSYLNDPTNNTLEEYGINYKFRLVDGTITPYLEIPFYNRIKSGEYAISSIIVSPSLNAEQKINGIEQYMLSLKTSFGGCEVNASTIPLRY